MSLTSLAEDLVAYENGELSTLQVLELFGHLIRQDLLWNLQGSYGRAGWAMIEQGLLDPETGDITDVTVKALAEQGSR